MQLCTLIHVHVHSLIVFQIAKTLESQPLQYLRPSEKVQVLSFLVEELLGSVALTREVDVKMEHIASFRREKWKISLKMKRYAREKKEMEGEGEGVERERERESE